LRVEESKHGSQSDGYNKSACYQLLMIVLDLRAQGYAVCGGT